MNIQKQIKLIKLIEQWAIDRGLDKNGTVEGQMIKTAEEVAELIIGISKDDIDVIKDSIGDVFVTFVIGNMIEGKYTDWDEDFNLALKTVLSDVFTKGKLVYDLAELLNDLPDYGYSSSAYPMLYILANTCAEYELKLIDCIESAYKEIADRKGVVRDGTFIKEDDLK
mgnify:CR=1 FL=1